MGKELVNEVSDISKRGEPSLFFCYSPAMSRHIQAKGLRVIGVGLNEHNGRKFWQFARGDELDEAITEWQANNPNK